MKVDYNRQINIFKTDFTPKKKLQMFDLTLIFTHKKKL